MLIMENTFTKIIENIKIIQ